MSKLQQPETKKRRIDLNDYSDGEANESSHAAVTWRADPSETLSDWTIDIKAEGSDEGSTMASFHVHKSIICAGQWRSKYFETLLRGPSNSSDTDQRGDKSCTVFLKPCATVKAFEFLLDHIYFGTSSIDGQDIVSLRYLAKKLRVKTLFDLSLQHIDDDLTAKTALSYLSESKAFGDEKLKAEAIKMCADEVTNIDKVKLLEVEPSDFNEIVSSVRESSIESRALSIIVAEYLRKHTNLTDESYFEAVCKSSFMPVLEPSEGLFYLQLARRWSDNLGPDECKDGAKSLEERGIKCCVDHWRSEIATSIEMDSSERNAAYDSLPNDIKITILEGALLNAKEALDTRIAYVEPSGEQQHTNAGTHAEEVLVDLSGDLSDDIPDDIYGDNKSSSSSDSDTSEEILEVSDEPIYN